MEELNLGETASWIAKVESNKFHLLITLLTAFWALLNVEN